MERFWAPEFLEFLAATAATAVPRMVRERALCAHTAVFVFLLGVLSRWLPGSVHTRVGEPCNILNGPRLTSVPRAVWCQILCLLCQLEKIELSQATQATLGPLCRRRW